MEYIDVFSGIGGIGLALAPFVKPLLYCEWDKYCQMVLTARMRDGGIDKAPIHADIKSLHLSPHMKPRMIGGGFPCQDISTAGNQLGMAGSRSSLFFEIMRLVDESPSITHVFLENVANIVKCGMSEVLEELQKRGFQIVWTTRSAAGAGAPHQRSRWFLLAVRSPARGRPSTDVGEGNLNNFDFLYDLVDGITSLKDDAGGRPRANASEGTGTSFQKDPWANEWPRRITFKPNALADTTWDPNWIARSHALGNTVVPCVVRAAFIELLNLTRRLDLVTEAMAPYACDASTLCYPFPEAGIIRNGTFVPLPSHKQQSANPSRVDNYVVFGDKTVKMCNYPTLRRGITHPSTVTERSLHDLPTVLCNTTIALTQVKEGLADAWQEQDRLQGLVIPNMNYLEWLQGYPADWTKIPDLVVVKSSSKAANAADADVVIEDHDDMLQKSKYASMAYKQPLKEKITRPKNGMHLFIKDNPGKDVRQVAILWRELPEETKTAYKTKAKELAMVQIM